MLRDLAEAALRLEEGGTFLGGPRAGFTRVGRNQLIVLLDLGLTPDAAVLDVGCGCLRGGWWLIQFLAPGRYHGIEPNRAMLEAGRDALLDPDVLRAKRPSFLHGEDFDFAAFGVPFDFVVARSVWTHAAPRQIEAMLDGFARVAAPGGVFAASYREPGPEGTYAGTEWVGRSHRSDRPGLVGYDLPWLEARCAERGLAVAPLYEESGQTWLAVHRAGEPPWRQRHEPAQGRIAAFRPAAPRRAPPKPP